MQEYNQNPWQPYDPMQGYLPPKKEKPDKITFGLISMIAGISALFLFMIFVNVGLAVVSIVFGIVQMCTAKRKGMAITGIVTSVTSVMLTVILWSDFFQRMSLDFLQK